MIQIERVLVSGIEPAIRGMRNPKNSWAKSDSCEAFNMLPMFRADDPMADEYTRYQEDFDVNYILGENDRDLAKKLISGGPVHGKFRRMIVVWLDLTAPLYWWKEFDTYKVGTVADSCSTMHKIHSKEFTLNDFSHEHILSMKEICPERGASVVLNNGPLVMIEDGNYWSPLGLLKMQIMMLNKCRKLYLETNDKTYWWQLIQLLPSSYNQMRTVEVNYEVLSNMYHSRKNHKLDEWHTFCDWVETLPYAKDLIVGN